MRISNRNRTRAIIESNDFQFKKKFGQNFLIEPNIIEKIIDGSAINENDVVIEIGPGIGSLTQFLAEKAKHVLAIEIDNDLIPILEENLEQYENITVINKDFLKYDIASYIENHFKNENIKVVANLPYYITTPIIMKILEEDLPIQSITVMIQKEVADRINAKPSTKDYGSLSLAVQYYCNTEIVAEVSPNNFIPAPRVGSTVICLTRKQEMLHSKDDKLLFKIVRGAFYQRRKTLLNSLSAYGDISISKEEIGNVLEKMEVKTNIRGEALSLEDFVSFTNIYIENYK